MLIGNNGILTQAKNAKTKTEEAQKNEENRLKEYENKMNQYVNGEGSGETVVDEVTLPSCRR